MNWWRSPLQRARRAARAGKWGEAAVAYQRHLTRDARNASIWVQLGHSLKENGDLHQAATAYREAVRLLPAAEDGWIHLAHLERRLGNREAAITALERAIAGGSTAAITALVDMGARERLPPAVQRQIEAGAGVHAVSRYAAWRETQAVSPADPLPDGGRPDDAPNVVAVIDARGAPMNWIAATRATLRNLPCLIFTDDSPEGRTSGEDGVIGNEALGAAGYLLLVAAGTRLAPGAIAVLQAAAIGTGAGAAYCDHDHWEETDEGIVHRDPCFQPMFDPLWFARAAVRPPCLLVTAAAAEAHATWRALFDHRLALPVSYAHVPRLLASRAADAPVAPIAPPPISPARDGVIKVIVQTRDAPEMLAACIDRLRATADRPDLLNIVIIDNRSVLPRTAALLADWAERGIACTIPHDEPFNWARANNMAAAAPAGDAPYLLFLNNDVEMASVGWDTLLRAGLAVEGVGALGALLLYPNNLVQHAGVVFGMGESGAVHEGVGQLPTAGPADRWRHPRLAAAVTGAWLAVTRTLFDTVKGFEERLPIAYNDVDFCLRIRAAGQGVMQASHIVAVHRESATRGSVMSSAEHARDQADWAWMRARWGAALDLDPGYNPHWLRIGQPFDGLHTPPADAVARWITASAKSRPWACPPPA